LETPEEQMEFLNRSRYALGICAAIAMLAGCNSAANVTPPQGNGVSLNSSQALHTIPYGLGALKPHHPHHNERLNGSITGFASCSYMNITVNGKAGGPYPGTFTGGVIASGNWCGAYGSSFSGIFTITSGSKTISGTFDGRIKQGGCNRTRGGGTACYGAGPLTYAATVEPGGKTLSGRGIGVLSSDEEHGVASMYLFLRRM
jgi:hypothetical protein